MRTSKCKGAAFEFSLNKYRYSILMFTLGYYGIFKLWLNFCQNFFCQLKLSNY